MLSRRGFLKAGLATGGLGLVAGTGAAYATQVETAERLIIAEYRPKPKNWPADFPLTIAIVSDVHAGGYNMTLPRIAAIVEATNRLGADLVVHLGDHEAHHHFMSDRPDPTRWGPAIGDLYAPLGVFGVLGNHDFITHTSEIRRTLEQRRVGLLENDAVLLEHKGRRFWLAGLADQVVWNLAHRREGFDDLPGTLAKIRTADPVILLAHEPDIFVDVPDRVALTLSGHTHGGQIWFPGMTARFIPSNFGRRFRYGHIVEDGRHLIVSGGLGCSGVPVRIGVPPEIVLVRLGT